MPIIMPNQAKTYEKIRIQVPSDLLEEVKNYCKEFSISEMGEFFVEAAKYVLKKDRDWQKIIKKSEKAIYKSFGFIYNLNMFPDNGNKAGCKSASTPFHP